MNLSVCAQKIAGKAVLVRLDLDLPATNDGYDTTRLEDGLETLQFLLDKKAKSITIIAHRGQPKGKKDSKLSILPFEKLILEKLKNPGKIPVKLRENLRFDPREEKNDPAFAKELAKGHDVFVNDAFASSHREHASIVGVPKLLTSCLGMHFEKELKFLKACIQTPKRPVLFILGGGKPETKLQYVDLLAKRADVLLVGGILAKSFKDTPPTNRRMIVGALTEDGFDITQPAIDQFLRFIAMAKTIVWNGPVGKYEDIAHEAGTRTIAEALSSSSAITVIGGGDTEAALTKFNITKGITFVSSGGGAMLEFLAHGTLVGIDAVEK
jgi:3-phosphoglycerate kinase